MPKDLALRRLPGLSPTDPDHAVRRQYVDDADNQAHARLTALELTPYAIGAANPNTHFANGAGGWNFGWTSGTELTQGVVIDAANAYVGTLVSKTEATANTPVGSPSRQQTLDAIPVNPGEVWTADAWVKASAAGYDQAYIQAQMAATAPNAQYFGTGPTTSQSSAFAVTTGYQKISHTWTIPAGMYFMRVDVRHQVAVQGGFIGYTGGLVVRRSTPISTEAGYASVFTRGGSAQTGTASQWNTVIWNTSQPGDGGAAVDTSTGVITLEPGSYDIMALVYTNAGSEVRLSNVAGTKVYATVGAGNGAMGHKTLNADVTVLVSTTFVIQVLPTTTAVVSAETSTWPCHVEIRRRYGVKGDDGADGPAGPNGSPAVTSRWAGNVSSIPAGANGTGMGTMTRTAAWSANDVGVVSAVSNGITIANATNEVQLWSVTMVVRSGATITAGRWILGLMETAPTTGAVIYRSAGSLSGETDVAVTFTVPVLPGGRSMYPQIYQSGGSAVSVVETRIEATRINGAQGPAGANGVDGVTPTGEVDNIANSIVQRNASGRFVTTGIDLTAVATDPLHAVRLDQVEERDVMLWMGA